MTLIDDTRDTLTRLAGQGWQPLFDLMGIDPVSPDLREQLATPVADHNAALSLPGFEDLAKEAQRPIESGSPARSILFHALSSPAVTNAPDGTKLTGFPTPRDLDRLENLVFGMNPPSIEDIMARFPGQHIAVGVFSREYRLKAWTAHSKHADLVFSRCGVARVGTKPAAWDGAKRAYSPLEPGDDKFAFRTLPCRYGAYVAVQLPGSQGEFLPYKFDRTFTAAQRFGTSPQSDASDAERSFWVPVHKVFSGDECLQGHNLQLQFEERHFNEKLRRIHALNMGRSTLFDSGFSEPEISDSPFRRGAGLAEFLEDEGSGPGILNTVPQPRFVEPVEIDDAPVGANMPSGGPVLVSSFNIQPEQHNGPGGRADARKAPEFVHVRTHLRNDGTTEDLNKFRNVAEIVNNGRVNNSASYRALHYTDFTGDGWVTTNLNGAPPQLDRKIPAYSILAAPDFYPYVSQSDVLDWSLNVRSIIRERLWSTPPLSLCDQRVAPNLALVNLGAPFVAEDKTTTAMVGMPESITSTERAGSAEICNRVTYLPDGAAGVYAPGWDTSLDFDTDRSVWHLAAHGLGSPFPEDAKLCAALSAFWPAVAPDTARSFGLRLVAPMSDVEVGLDTAPPWDGVVAPRIEEVGGQEFLEEDNFDHIDYVKSALAGKFTLSETMLVDRENYQARILATHQLMLMLQAEFGNSNIRMASFSEASSEDGVLSEIQDTLIPLAGRIYRFIMVETAGRGTPFSDSTDETRWLARSKILAKLTAYVDETGRSAFSRNGGDWQVPGTS